MVEFCATFYLINHSPGEVPGQMVGTNVIPKVKNQIEIESGLTLNLVDCLFKAIGISLKMLLHFLSSI